MMAQANLSLAADFDRLTRHYDKFINSNSSAEFLEIVANFEECRRQWEDSALESIRLQHKVRDHEAEIQRQEKKIHEIRRHLESKMEVLNKLEIENERLDLRNTSARAVANANLNDPRVGSEARERLRNVLAILETGDSKKIHTYLRSPAGGLDTISEAGSTDLSMTQSEDDLDLSGIKSRRSRKKRPSMEAVAVLNKRQRKSGTTIELQSNDRLIAKTVVSFPKDGQVTATASLEAVPGGGKSSKASEAQMIMQPSAPPMPTSESESDAGGWNYIQSPKKIQSSGVYVGGNNSSVISTQQSPRFGRTLSSGGAMAMRPHAFCQKTVIKPETCEPCGKRIKFSKLALKCRDCKATCHPECRDKVPLPCVVTGTPSNKAQAGSIADYAPANHPMVPGIVQHCVNEIEIRGFDTVGLYRVPGQEKEVKELKERFLRGKGIPNLSKYDIHAVCGCIKDFLRSLQEPLIGRWFWRDFALASEISTINERQAEIDRIVRDLPPPNQDTLGFVILHLQRVAEAKDVKMPISNLAKVFGPTIVGYSGPDIDAQTMLKETKRQQNVLETLLNMPSEFWSTFVYRQDEKPAESGTYTRSKGRTIQASFTPQSSNAHNSVNRVKGSSRKIYFTDDSPKEVKSKALRKFFDE